MDARDLDSELPWNQYYQVEHEQAAQRTTSEADNGAPYRPRGSEPTGSSSARSSSRSSSSQHQQPMDSDASSMKTQDNEQPEDPEPHGSRPDNVGEDLEFIPNWGGSAEGTSRTLSRASSHATVSESVISSDHIQHAFDDYVRPPEPIVVSAPTSSHNPYSTSGSASDWGCA